MTMRPTTTRIPRWKADDVPSYIIIGFSAVVVILNAVEATLLIRLGDNKKLYEIILLSLSIADALFGTANIAMSSFYAADKIRIPNAIEISYTMYFYFILTSIAHLLWITFDRVWIVFRPLKHRVWMTKKRVNIILTLTWFFTTAAVLSLYLGYHAETGFHQKPPKNATRKQRGIIRRQAGAMGAYATDLKLTISSLIAIADVVLVVCYTCVIYRVSCRSKNQQISKLGNVQDKVSFVCILVTSAFVVSTLPYALNSFVYNNVPTYASVLLLVNSGLNSIVYFFRGWFAKLKKNRYDEQASNSEKMTPLNRKR